jgi:hypothetical protein
VEICWKIFHGVWRGDGRPVLTVSPHATIVGLHTEGGVGGWVGIMRACGQQGGRGHSNTARIDVGGKKSGLAGVARMQCRGKENATFYYFITPSLLQHYPVNTTNFIFVTVITTFIT